MLGRLEDGVGAEADHPQQLLPAKPALLHVRARAAGGSWIGPAAAIIGRSHTASRRGARLLY
eukprot:6863387-Prymnesium_polylepis.2